MRTMKKGLLTAVLTGALAVAATPSPASAQYARCSEVARRHPYRLLAFYFWNPIIAGVWEYKGCPRGVID